ncbi:MAG TPA: pyridoxal phosphate-dependent aminotransferase [Myxococcaceae bacterium]|jgi:aminotransferase
MPPRPRADVVASAHDEIRVMTREARRSGAINLAQGVGELPVLPEAVDAAVAALRGGQHGYSIREGRAELREAIARRCAVVAGIRPDPETGVVVTAGAVGAYSAAIGALLAPGDGLLLCEPFFTFHRVPAVVAGLEVSAVRREAPGFRLEEGALRAALRPNTRAVVVCTPCNPSGHVMDEGEIEALAKVAAERDLLVLSDEVYAEYVFGGAVHRSPAAHPALRDRTVLLGSLSKAFHVTGWRIGWAVAAAPLAEAIKVANNADIGCAPVPLQLGAVAALGAGEAYFGELRRQTARKRDVMVEALRALGAAPYPGDGGCFLLADVRALGYRSSREAAMALLHDAGVAAAPGFGFYLGGAGGELLRFGFGVAEETVKKAAAALAGARGQLRTEGEHLRWPVPEGAG